MHFLKAALTIYIIVMALGVSAQPIMDPQHEIRVDVVYLASDYLEGRDTGSKGEALAASYIAERFQEIGLQPAGEAGTWFQTFELTFKPNPHAATGEQRKATNVIGFVDNGAAKTVVIGGHYDHLGMGAHGSRHVGTPEIHNGADDNASGVAAMLYLAEQLADGRFPHNNYLFIGFSGEELGLFGSKYFVNNPTIDLEQVNYMLNMDMVGRLNEEGVLVINGAGTSPAWKPAFEKIDLEGITIQTTDSGIGPSDHTSFYLNDIPAIHFFTGQHTDYHKPVDDSHLVNFEGIQLVADYMLALIAALDDAGTLDFTKTKDEQESRQASSFKVTLGVMPDYVYQGEGMRVDAVIPDRPGANGGLENGDVIIQIGDLKVKDIYDYMEGLSKFKPGETTTVIVIRGKKELEKKITF
ncbi:MAG: M28 family peptidase [Phaeodactylibacter sp.]|nr:M28 family peptidase [Phaeodactylibacter sp.]